VAEEQPERVHHGRKLRRRDDQQPPWLGDSRNFRQESQRTIRNMLDDLREDHDVE
jgi:hypothetical protein